MAVSILALGEWHREGSTFLEHQYFTSTEEAKAVKEADKWLAERLAFHGTAACVRVSINKVLWTISG